VDRRRTPHAAPRSIPDATEGTCSPPGGNDFVRHNLQVCFKHIQDSIEYLHRAFPASIIVWANILPRFNWRAPETENKQIDKKRKRVNQFGHNMMRVVEGHE
jgi:hypothetical protein